MLDWVEERLEGVDDAGKVDNAVAERLRSCLFDEDGREVGNGDEHDPPQPHELNRVGAPDDAGDESHRRKGSGDDARKGDAAGVTVVGSGPCCCPLRMSLALLWQLYRFPVAGQICGGKELSLTWLLARLLRAGTTYRHDLTLSLSLLFVTCACR